MWEGRVAAGAQSRVGPHVAQRLSQLQATEGCLDVEAFQSFDHGDEGGDDRIVIITRWRDVAALERAVGPGWRADSYDDEPDLWARPPHVWHFEQWQP